MGDSEKTVQQRDKFKSKFGFIMSAAVSSVGLGIIWKFPCIVGKNGGGAHIAYLSGCREVKPPGKCGALT